jgi:hypothetical protein
MGRRRVPNDKLDAFLQELRESGVEDIDVRPAGEKGWATVWWEEPDREESSKEGSPEKLFRWSLIFILLGFTLAIYLLSIIMGGLLGGLGSYR